MKTHSRTIEAAAPASAGEGILCAKCEHRNPPHSNVCELCEAHLYISCHACGARNERVAIHCHRCGQGLHRSRWRRWQKKLFPERHKLRPIHVVLLIAAVALTYKAIVFIAESRVVLVR